MPRVTGLELVRQLRARDFGGKIVVLSAFLNEENVRAYEALGVDLMLAKPFDMDELRKAIGILADSSGLRSSRERVALSRRQRAFDLPEIR